MSDSDLIFTLRRRRRRAGFGLAGLFLNRLEQRAELAAGALERAGELPARPEQRRHKPGDRLLAGRKLADGLHSLVTDVQFAVEERAAQLELLGGLLLFHQ